MTEAAASKPSLILVTGFLGAGKTTALNRVLGHRHHRRIGVIVNELGRIDIDARLIKSRAGDVMELVGGCVCHEVRVQSELWAAMEEVRRRSNPEIIMLETTGIAEPWSILDGLEALSAEEAPAVAAGVVCVVDAEAGLAHLVEPLLAVIDGLGSALVRAKGFVRLSGELRRGYLERAGLHTSLQLGDSWGSETPRTEIVLIGENLDPAAIQRQLWACRVKS